MSDRQREKIQRWYKWEHADGVVVVGRRGRTAIKAVDLDDDGTLYPILKREGDLEGMEQVEPSEVPDEAKEYIRKQHRIRSENIDLIRQAGGSSD